MMQVATATLLRRALLAGFATLILAFVLAVAPVTGARAEQANGAPDFVRTFGEDAIAVLANGSLSDSGRQAEFRHLFTAGFDVPVIARFVLGKHWRKATEAQRSEYADLFEDFIVTTYARRLQAYTNETLEVGKARYDDDKAVVRSQILRPGANPIQVDWQLRRSGERWYFVDIVVEGLSMALTQRSEFGAVIQGGGIDDLLAKLREKSAQIRSANHLERVAARDN